MTTRQGLAVRTAAQTQQLQLPIVEPAERHEARIDLTPNGPVSQATPSSLGVQLQSADRTLTIALFTDLITVQQTAYGHFSKSFRPALRAALTAATQEFAPETVRRVGLRYVNRLVDQTARSPHQWAGRIKPAVLGVLAEQDVVASTVQTAQQQIQLDFGDACGAIIRHGAFVDAAEGNAYSYLVDLDVFSQVTDVFDAEQIMATVRRLNVTALALFQWVVTATWRDSMGPVPVERTKTSDATEPSDPAAPPDLAGSGAANAGDGPQ